jgi:hypothetical protein
MPFFFFSAPGVNGRLFERFDKADPMGYYVTSESTATETCRPKTAYPRFPGAISGHRYYDPVTARWLSRNPIGEQGELDAYGFVGNAPTIHFDVIGLAKCKVTSFKFKMRSWKKKVTLELGWRRQLPIEFTLLLDKCVRKEDCIIDQDCALTSESAPEPVAWIVPLDRRNPSISMEGIIVRLHRFNRRGDVPKCPWPQVGHDYNVCVERSSLFHGRNYYLQYLEQLHGN